MDEEDIEAKLDETLRPKNAKNSIKPKKKPKKAKKQPLPEKLFILPMTRRPFFPGMAAPLVIEPGVYYEVLKNVAKSDNKMLGLFLTKDEDVNIYKMGINDLHKVGVVAKILRIVPLDQGGGAQVVLSMEQRVKIDKKSLSIFRNNYDGIRVDLSPRSDNQSPVLITDPVNVDG